MDETAIRSMFEAYKAGFETYDTRTLSTFFSFPCQIVGTVEPPGTPTIGVLRSAEAYIQAIDGFLDFYKAAGVRSGQIDRFDVAVRAADLAAVDIQWTVAGEGGRALYTFDAFYTLLRTPQGWRICAIAHGEGPALARCLREARA